MRAAGKQGLAQQEGRVSSQLAISTRPDLDVAVHILQAANLPTEDLTVSHLEHFSFSGPAAQPTGLVGLEIFGDVALLRSLVVAPDRRGRGDGQRLLEHAENHARSSGVRTIYLLTTTAEGFFARHGFARLARDDAPAAIQSTREFAGICPASSAFMGKVL
jgi:amino-acid N-acetyltransferase